MASTFDKDWQSSKKTILQRNSHMFNNPLLSDVMFTCGESKGKQLYAHKYVLATSSAVFYAMFYGKLAQKDSIVHLPDTDEESLEEFLRFLYTDDCLLTMESVTKVLYLAKKYIIVSLTDKCIEFISANTKPENVFTVLERAAYLDEKELEAKCWRLVEFQTRKALASTSFCNISRDTLTDILKRDMLNITELELFKGVLKWSESQSSKSGLEVSGRQRRAVIGDAVYHIRFLSMSQKEFAQNVSLSGLLTAEELVSIYNSFNGLELSRLKCKQTKRKPCLQRFARFRLSDIENGGYSAWAYGQNHNCLSFSVNKPTIFHGVRLFGDANERQYDVTLEVNGTLVSATYTSERNSDGVYGFDVMFPTPVSVEADQDVTMVAKIRGPPSSFGRNGKQSVQLDGLTVTFKDTIWKLANDSDINIGQFYQLVLSPAADES